MGIRVGTHFDNLSLHYDSGSILHKFYYKGIKNLYNKIIGRHRDIKILDIGCATGELLHFLNPGLGIGIDISLPMILLAKNKCRGHKELLFVVGDAQNLCLKSNVSFAGTLLDYVTMVDVVEHLQITTSIANTVNTVRQENNSLHSLSRKFFLDWRERTFSELEKIVTPDTKIVISLTNSLYKNILSILEKMRLKMPEGPHYWISLQELKIVIKKYRFEIIEEGTFWPFFCKKGMFKKLGFTQWII